MPPLADAAPAHMRIERVTRALTAGGEPYRGVDGREDVLTLRWRTQPYRAGVMSLASCSAGLATVSLMASGHVQPGWYAAMIATFCALGVVGARRRVEVTAAGITVFTPVGGGQPRAVSTRALVGLVIAEHDDDLRRYRVMATLRDAEPAPLFDTVHRREAIAAVAAIERFLGLTPTAGL
jgi:hypothetical protein